MIGSVAVLGAGIMGCSTALHLARRGVRVTLVDQAPAPFTGASRWNEGKIHLGFLYAADPELRTARAVLAGGLDFRDHVERLTGIDLAPLTTPVDDHYLVHRDSVVPADAVGAYADRVAALVASAPGAGRYLVDVSRCPVHRLGRAELDELSDPASVVAGVRVPERSVDTVAVADAFVAAVAAEPRIEAALGQRVTSVAPAGESTDRWVVRTSDGTTLGPFDAVVNALWEGRPAVDATLGHRPDADQQHRFRLSLFVRAREPVDAPCAVLSVGPFGDVKNYGGDRFYLSWYPLGLVARAEAVEPPPVPELTAGDRAELAARVFAALAEHLPWVRDVEAAADEVRVEGGWVYSQGRGLLDDPGASVHHRDLLGVTNVGTYFSVDTGKYSVAPTLAEGVAAALTAR
jgi:glycine/D-amino acid oxidase-like deaminating enzyme